MSEAAFTGVQNPTGPVNTGPGTQHNTFTAYHYHQASAASRRPLVQPLSDEHLAWLEQRFVRPVGMTAAARRLRSEHVVLLDAAPGSGREATAKMLLRGIGGHRAARRLLAEDDDARPTIPTGDQVSEGGRLLLDLSDARGEAWERLRSRLPELMESVRERRAHLVMIVPHGAEQLGDELAVHRSAFARPEAERVLALAIRAEGLPPSEELDERPESVRAFLAERPPLREVNRLAALVAESCRTSPGGRPAEWFADALESLRRPGTAVVELVRKLERGDQRALLLATAMLPGVRSDALHRAHALLLEAVAHPGDERPVLEREDLSERLDAIDAEVMADGSVSFRRTGFAEAVRDHFWTHRPDLWDVYRGWVDASLRRAGLDGERRDELVAGYAEQALRTGQAASLRDQAWQWAQPEQRQIQAAVQALGHGLSDPRTGREFRRTVYDWSTTPGLAVGVTQVLAAVSADVIAPSHPDQALVRLHHLARNTTDARQSGVDARLVMLAREDDRLYRKLLRRIAAGSAGRVHPADVRLFHACAAPSVLLAPLESEAPARLLIDTGGTLEALAAAWRALLADRRPDEWLSTAKDWMTAALTGNDHGDVLLRVLVKAASPHPAALDRLYLASLRYPCAPRVRRLVDLAQGVRPRADRG